MIFGSFMMMPSNTLRVSAEFKQSFLNHALTDHINDDDREIAYGYLIQCKNTLINSGNLTQETIKKLEDLWYQANVYIADTDMLVSQLIDYVNTMEANMKDVAGDGAVSYASPEQFIFISNASLVSTARYGELTTVTLSLVNLGMVDITDLVITPQEDPDVGKWPFEITTASNALIIPKLCASNDIYQAHAMAQEATWYFYVAGDAKTGTYPLDFKVQYYRNGQIESTTVTTYINIIGNPSAGNLYDSAQTNPATSTPRIIVTGFTTNPDVVYAGDTFNLTVTVQNTSLTTAVSNIQFDFTAANEGSNSETTYEAFLPTSGSATKFMTSIPAGATATISIEMTARSDLAQKPYVITLNAAYEDNQKKPYTMSSNISIPVRQEARVDFGDAEILPESIEVGGSANIMFPVYNKGKTTLYNVQVDFIGDSVEGGSTFLGKLEPGATGSVDAMVSGVAPTEDDGIIIARISYEDEAGNVSYLDKEIFLYVSEPYYGEDDYGWDETDPSNFDGEYDEEKGGTGVYWKPIVITVIVIVVAAIVVWRVVSGKRRKKKMLKDLEDLDDDDEI